MAACSQADPLCPYCNQPAEWVPNSAVYGRRYGNSWMIWLCRCQPGFVYVGCHQNTRQPLGRMANQELRAARIAAHNAIDPIWREGEMKRQAIYAWLRNRFGEEVHVGQSDLERCLEIVEAAAVLLKELDAEHSRDDENDNWADGHPLDYGDS